MTKKVGDSRDVCRKSLEAIKLTFVGSRISGLLSTMVLKRSVE